MARKCVRVAPGVDDARSPFMFVAVGYVEDRSGRRGPPHLGRRQAATGPSGGSVGRRVGCQNSITLLTLEFAGACRSRAVNSETPAAYEVLHQPREATIRPITPLTSKKPLVKGVITVPVLDLPVFGERATEETGGAVGVPSLGDSAQLPPPPGEEHRATPEREPLVADGVTRRRRCYGRDRARRSADHLFFKAR